MVHGECGVLFGSPSSVSTVRTVKYRLVPFGRAIGSFDQFHQFNLTPMPHPHMGHLLRLLSHLVLLSPSDILPHISQVQRRIYLLIYNQETYKEAATEEN